MKNPKELSSKKNKKTKIQKNKKLAQIGNLCKKI